jgi:hypothetical protein
MKVRSGRRPYDIERGLGREKKLGIAKRKVYTGLSFFGNSKKILDFISGTRDLSPIAGANVKLP